MNLPAHARTAPISETIRPFFRLATALALICASTVAAQGNVIIVDAAGGPGSQFTSLRSAVIAAMPGDLLQIRAGNYGSITINKPLHLRGENRGTVRIIANAKSRHAVVISGLTNREALSMQDLTIISPRATAIAQCRGSVLIDNVIGSFSVTDSSNVELRDVQGNQFLISDSSVALTRSNVIHQSPAFPTPAVAAVNSNLHITDGLFLSLPTPSPVLALQNSTVTTSGLPLLIGAGPNGVAITGTGSVTGAMSVTGGIQPPIVRNSTSRNPSLSLRPGSAQNIVDIVIGGAAGEIQVVVVGIPSAPRSQPGIFGSLWMDFPTILAVNPSSQPVSTYSLTIPNMPAFLGAQIAAQALTTFQQEPLRFTNPAQYVVQ